MNYDFILKLSYAVMILAVVLCYLLVKRQQRNLRLAVNRFAFAFVKISNFVSPMPRREKLRVTTGKKGTFEVLPAAEQSETMRAVFQRAGEEAVVSLYGELSDALEGVRRNCGKNKKLTRQFFDPVAELFGIARLFLVGCEDLANINSELRAESFNSFLTEQVKHRKTLLRRISGDAGHEYAELNLNYDLTAEET